MSVSRSDPFLPIQTKLYPPRARTATVVRPRLLDMLQSSLERQLTLISAAAGYGKTTLLRSWIEALDCPWAWFSLDEYDDDLITFATYITAAVRTAYSETVPVTHTLLASPTGTQPGHLADTLTSELCELPGSLILILDDYHLAKASEIHIFMNRLLERLPSSVHLVVSARSDPSFPLANLRARGQITEIRGRHLRMTPEESVEFLQLSVKESPSDQIVALFAERTEGWPAGLHLAALSVQDSVDPEDFARRFASGNSALIADYLSAEVLENLPKEQKSLVLRTTLVDRICGSLCEELADGALKRGDGERFVRDIWTSNLFMTALDGEGIWYRFHHLFRDIALHQLRQSVSAEEISRMHLRASKWFATHGLMEEAIIHAVQSGDHVRAAQLVEAHFVEALNSEEWRRLDRWLSLLPDSVLQRPMLLVARAYLRQVKFEYMVPLLDEAEGGLEAGITAYEPDHVRFIRGSIALLRAISLARTETGTVEQILASARQGLEWLSGQGEYVEGLAELTFIGVLQFAGRLEEALQYANWVLRQCSGNPDARLFRALLALCFVHYAEANVYALQSAARTYRQLAQDAHRELSLGWSSFFLGWTHYQSNELAAARDCFEKVASIRSTAHSMPAVDSYIGLVLTLLAQGQTPNAQHVITELRGMLLGRGMVMQMPIADALESRLASEQQGGVTVPSAARISMTSRTLLSFWVNPTVMRIHSALASADPYLLDEAEEMLHEYRAAAEARNSRRRLLEIGALETLLHASRGDHDAALNALRAAVLMGEHGGALRQFVDVGPGLVPYFQMLLEQNIAYDYVRRILSAYETMTTSTGSNLVEKKRAGTNPGALLTFREREVLDLLSARMTDKEIAEALHISPRTVQGHTQNIYEKLGVNNRRQAVAKAETLGLDFRSPPT